MSFDDWLANFKFAHPDWFGLDSKPIPRQKTQQIEKVVEIAGRSVSVRMDVIVKPINEEVEVVTDFHQPDDWDGVENDEYWK